MGLVLSESKESLVHLRALCHVKTQREVRCLQPGSVFLSERYRTGTLDIPASRSGRNTFFSL